MVIVTIENSHLFILSNKSNGADTLDSAKSGVLVSAHINDTSMEYLNKGSHIEVLDTEMYLTSM